MGHLVLHHLDEDLLERLKTRAAADGRSPEEEHRAILEAALASPSESPDFWERTARSRQRLSGRTMPDTTRIIREMRDERAGLAPDAFSGLDRGRRHP